MLNELYINENDLIFENLFWKNDLNNIFYDKDIKNNINLFIHSLPIEYFKIIDLYNFIKILIKYKNLNSKILLKLYGISFNISNIFICYYNENQTLINLNDLNFNEFLKYLSYLSNSIDILHQNKIFHYHIKENCILLNNNFYQIGFLQPIQTQIIEQEDLELITNTLNGYQFDSFLFGILIYKYLFKKNQKEILQLIWNFEELLLIENNILNYLIQNCLSFDLSKKPSFNEICNFLNQFYNFQIEKPLINFKYNNLFNDFLNLVDNSFSNLILGTLYCFNEIIPKSFEKAEYYLTKCLNSSIAQNNLGKLLYKNNQELSFKLIQQSANNNYSIGLLNYSKLLTKNIKFDDISIESIEKILISSKYLKLSADKGLIESICLYSNIIRLKDPIQSFYYMKLAAHRGDLQAIHMLGIYYENGTGVEINKIQMLNYWKYGLSMKSPLSMNNIGTNLNDINESFKLWKESAELGTKQAQYNLGLCYLYGKGCIKNENEAFNWFLKSAEQGFLNSIYNIGLMYRDGIGIEKNQIEAEKWCKIGSNTSKSLGHFYKILDERKLIAEKIVL